ncbi:hypothetical protein DOTSEDRAFT_177660 [Dothistroma septosporum NZE10]|uniref:Uncharacterized protein n=1 Tax=Dothistroma septosporum (strain NZE10 / CBS 128990) TaxID=675120 RepID=N1PH06_DOTSN|nr:hypothetical protein DOTSEDRAFT_177660 [Dothistroma septosporum NZE10]
MLASIVRYADDTAGLEKTLRLLQGLCTIAVGLVESAPQEAAYWVKLRAQLALGRRYFRLLKWHPCWDNAITSLGGNKPPLYKTLDVAKWSFIGMYFFLEMFTMTNAIGATSFEWAPMAQREANKCWFYGLIFSILVSLYELLLLQNTTPTKREKKASSDLNGSTVKDEVKGKPSAPSPSSPPDDIEPHRIWTQLAIDCNDLVIPGSAVGWMPVGPILVGTCSTISTVLAGRQIWNRVQQRAQQP